MGEAERDSSHTWQTLSHRAYLPLAPPPMALSFSKTARKRALSDSDVWEINRKKVKKMDADGRPHVDKHRHDAAHTADSEQASFLITPLLII